MDNKNMVGLGYICPMFTVESALACVSDKDGISAVDVKGAMDQILIMYAHIIEAVTMTIYKDLKDDVANKEGEVIKVIGEITAMGVSNGLRGAIKESEGDK